MSVTRFLPCFCNPTLLIMKSCSKSTAKKQGKIWWLIARWVGWGVALVQVVLDGFWVVSDGFCWLRIISDCFRLFAVLVATPISQHTEELSRSHVIESGHWIFLFKVKQQEKDCCFLTT